MLQPSQLTSGSSPTPDGPRWTNPNQVWTKPKTNEGLRRRRAGHEVRTILWLRAGPAGSPSDRK